MDIASLLWKVNPYILELLKFQFKVTNPVFWLLWFVIFLSLSHLWSTKKAIQFCLIIALLLLAYTHIETQLRAMTISSGDTFEAAFVRIIPCVTIAIVIISFIFF
jgi:hypothetical protein